MYLPQGGQKDFSRIELSNSPWFLFPKGQIFFLPPETSLGWPTRPCTMGSLSSNLQAHSSLCPCHLTALKPEVVECGSHTVPTLTTLSALPTSETEDLSYRFRNWRWGSECHPWQFCHDLALFSFSFSWGSCNIRAGHQEILPDAQELPDWGVYN